MKASVLLEDAECLRPIATDQIPLFRQDLTLYTLFYTPGFLTVIDRRDVERFSAALTPENHRRSQGSYALWQHATTAAKAWQQYLEASFQPECLTLYMNNECNLRCIYCHTAPSPKPQTRLQLETIVAAATVVATSCRSTKRPFYIVFHGGGEPTLNFTLFTKTYNALAALTARYDIPTFWYVATNGLLSEEQARWLARHFDLVGLSCDGPPYIQDTQRPRWDGGATSQGVERTAHILREEGARVNARTTITPSSLSYQAEIADYICRKLQPAEIHFEPVYVGGRTLPDGGLQPQHAVDFITHFQKAQEITKAHDIPLITSGSQPSIIHGPYCHVFRNVINLIPGGLATACFKRTTPAQVQKATATETSVMGWMDDKTGAFELDMTRIYTLRQKLGPIPSECEDCFNAYHCTKSCPDYCPLDIAPQRSRRASFRCLVYKTLTYAKLRDIAAQLWHEIQTKPDWQHGTIRHLSREL